MIEYDQSLMALIGVQAPRRATFSFLVAQADCRFRSSHAKSSPDTAWSNGNQNITINGPDKTLGNQALLPLAIAPNRRGIRLKTPPPTARATDEVSLRLQRPRLLRRRDSVKCLLEQMPHSANVPRPVTYRRYRSDVATTLLLPSDIAKPSDCQ